MVSSQVNIYVGCEQGDGQSDSTAGGTVLRFNLIDATGVWVLMDYALVGAGGGRELLPVCLPPSTATTGCDWVCILRSVGVAS